MKSWWRAVLSYPPTWIAAVMLAVTVWLLWGRLDPSGAAAVILIILAAVAILTWPLTMSATGTLARLQFEIPRVEEIDLQQLSALTAELEVLIDSQPARQLAALQERRESLTRILQRRMDAGELTYARYLSTAHQVYTSAMDNLQEVAVAHQSISSIDEDYIAQRLEELEHQGESGSETADRERSSLERRRDLRQDQLAKITGLLAQSEAALTALDRTTTALADSPIGKKPQDAEAAMQALEELAERAGRYT